ncbi:hypothetical protein JRI60_06520 [Archangium violaceum]|uniref:hypothetical protein n=1 Tax=Archangium violaceum TaxID=83451 RepID=UPI0019503AD0|nr:hypothetical protein [Archangium violaceum]QRN98693.1 hypothetical protein JRI60_06520 [Archangium violaceum]
MHRASGVHANRLWKGLMPTALLALAVGCGGAETGTPGDDSGQPPVQTTGPETPAPGTGPSAGTPGSSAPKPEKGAPAPGDSGPPSRSWFHRLGGPQDDLGTALAVARTGDISVVWLSTPREDDDRESVPGQRRGLSVAKYGPDGTERWTRDYSRMRVASPLVGSSPSGEVFLTGNAFLYPLDFGLGEANDGFLVKFSESGEPLWQRRVGQKVYGLAADGEGGVLVAAEEWTPEGHVPVLAHHDAQGTYLWTRQLDVVADGTELFALGHLPSGRALLAGRLVGTLRVDGRTFGAEGSQGLVLLAFEPDGRLAWGRELRGVDGRVTGLKPGPDESVALVGEFRGTLAWGGTTLTGPGAFVLAAGPEGAERWAQPLACGANPASPAVTVDDEGGVVAACGGVLSLYEPEGAQRDQRTLSPGECPESSCPVTSTALGFVPGQGLTLAGYQRHGGAQAENAWDQEAFLRLLVP